ncbi:hypothetical protein M407DRAFT_89032 [Tulasnella calospora MUT 4182]|uniref:Uncharacterized protein n=1 Tax=Tulasnella calospora MUT 4182 TaxID=1051891 RepID=A0A0C3QX92_9AGAM|nr:hypothetical protein M407DRAFT_89032 [Tulasnella calospora MUT 4182]
MDPAFDHLPTNRGFRKLPHACTRSSCYDHATFYCHTPVSSMCLSILSPKSFPLSCIVSSCVCSSLSLHYCPFSHCLILLSVCSSLSFAGLYFRSRST